MVLGNPAIIVQDMLRKTPETLNAVDMVLAAIGKGFRMVQAMVLAPVLERVVAAEGVGVVDQPLPRVPSDMRHQLVSRHSFHNFSVYPPIPLQKPENNAFSGRTSSALALAPAAEVGLIYLDLSFRLPASSSAT